jgi:hypothetical protein
MRWRTVRLVVAQAHRTTNTWRKVMAMPHYGSADDLTALVVV